MDKLRKAKQASNQDEEVKGLRSIIHNQPRYSKIGEADLECTPVPGPALQLNVQSEAAK